MPMMSGLVPGVPEVALEEAAGSEQAARAASGARLRR
jgi:hypothetical protein